jgi:hypothetical protein
MSSQQPMKMLVVGSDYWGQAKLIRSITDLHQCDEMGDGFYELPVENGAALQLYNPRPASLMRLLQQGPMGAIVVVDGKTYHDDRDARALIETLNNYAKVPFVVAVRKWFHRQILDLAMCRYELNVPKDIPLVPFMTTDCKSVHDIMRTLMYGVLDHRGVSGPHHHTTDYTYAKSVSSYNYTFAGIF